jgi:hypothetical protein
MGPGWRLRQTKVMLWERWGSPVPQVSQVAQTTPQARMTQISGLALLWPLLRRSQQQQQGRREHPPA